MSDESTLKIAVRAETKVDQHIDDCVHWRERVSGSLDAINRKIESLQSKVLLILGGIITFSTLVNLGVALFHK